MNLTQHFTLDEFVMSQTAVRRGINNAPTDLIIPVLKRTAETLEVVRQLLGKPIVISSGYRCAELNAAVGGSKKSMHMTGQAVDFTCPSFGTPYRIVDALMQSHLVYDQLIYEFGAWVHLGVSDTPRKQVLTIDSKGTREGLFQIRE